MTNPTTQPPNQRLTQRSRGGQTPRHAQRPGMKLASTRRDAKPLVFGWGKDLTRVEREHYQRLAAWGFGGLVIVAILGIVAFSILQQLLFIPNSTIIKVNSTSVSQDAYRKLLAYTAQDEWNSIQADSNKLDGLKEKALAGDNSVATEFTVLTSQIQTENAAYGQSSITQHVIDMEIEDVLIQKAMTATLQQHPEAKKQLDPSAYASQITARLNSFKSSFPKGESYSDFLSKNSMSESDTRAAAAIYVRRDVMKSYLDGQISSPLLEPHLRHIEIADKGAANKLLSDMKAKKLTTLDASWKDVVAANTLDVDTKNNGGDMGFIVTGTNDAAVEAWALAPNRKPGDVAVIDTAGGTHDIVQLLEVAPKPVDATQLQSLQSNALDHWLSGQRVSPDNSVGKVDSDAMVADRNLPRAPDLNAKLPNVSVTPPAAPAG